MRRLRERTKRRRGGEKEVSNTYGMAWNKSGLFFSPFLKGVSCSIYEAGTREFRVFPSPPQNLKLAFFLRVGKQRASEHERREGPPPLWKETIHFPGRKISVCEGRVERKKGGKQGRNNLSSLVGWLGTYVLRSRSSLNLCWKALTRRDVFR